MQISLYDLWAILQLRCSQMTKGNFQSERFILHSSSCASAICVLQTKSTGVYLSNNEQYFNNSPNMIELSFSVL